VNGCAEKKQRGEERGEEKMKV